MYLFTFGKHEKKRICSIDTSSRARGILGRIGNRSISIDQDKISIDETGYLTCLNCLFSFTRCLGLSIAATYYSSKILFS